MLEENKILREFICPVCGKHFIPAPFHRYVLYYQGVKIVCCRWNCYVKAQRAKDEAERQNYEEGVRKRKIIHENKKKEDTKDAN